MQAAVPNRFQKLFILKIQKVNNRVDGPSAGIPVRAEILQTDRAVVTKNFALTLLYREIHPEQPGDLQVDDSPLRRTSAERQPSR
jgi:hypothetical protein